MTSPTRTSLVALLAGAAVAVSAPVAQAASFGVEETNFEAGTCTEEKCTYASIEKAKAEKKPSEAFTQAAGHPPFGLTTFEFNHTKVGLGDEPVGRVKNIRVDIPPGVAADPEAVGHKCSIKTFMAIAKEPCPANTEVGKNLLTVFVGAINETIIAPVYNLEPSEGLPLEFGIKASPTEGSLLQGHVSWHKEKVLEEAGIVSGDYHEYFEINEVPEKIPVLKSKLAFKGTKTGEGAYGNFLTLPSVCSSTTVSYLRVESWKGEVVRTQTKTPVGVEGCNLVPFEPTASLTPETAQSDQPDGATVEVKVLQNEGGGEINTTDIKDAHVTLPEGMTLNPATAQGLETCTEAQIAIDATEPVPGKGVPEVSCPAGSKVGTVAIETDLPPGALAGNVYLGSPTGATISGPPFTIYVDAEAKKYGISVRLKGLVEPNPATGRLETTFTESPPLPFSKFTLKLNGGPFAPVANPLTCGTGLLGAEFTPYTGLAAWLSSSPFNTEGCPNPLPFSLSQSTQDEPANAGAHTSYTFNLARADGQQYLSKVTTALPTGLVGLISSITPCAEPQAAGGTCSAASAIGTATVSAGAGSSPLSFAGPVFLTGPYSGAPYGLSIAVPAVAGPFNFGTVVTRATINVDPTTARVTVTSDPLPTIIKGVPIRLKAISVAVNRPNFLLNPTNCAALSTDTTLTSTFGATQALSSPFAVGNCGALAFAPVFTAATNANASKANGASLLTTVSQPAGQANIHAVTVQLPNQLSTRLTTLQQACPAATYAANRSSCPAGSNVGTATAWTPVLATALTGPAYLVSHGGEAFPDLDILLEGSGVHVVLVGSTNIKAGVTQTTFASLPDVPVSSFALNLPSGPHSVLSANGDLCAAPLVMPITFVAQNGAQVHQNATVAVAGCGSGSGAGGNHGKHARRGVRILRYKVVHSKLLLWVQTFAPGRIAAGGGSLTSVRRRLAKPAKAMKLTLSLSRKALKRHRPLRVRVRVSFAPAQRGAPRSSASVRVTFR